MSNSSGVVHTKELPWSEQAHGDRFQVRRKQLGIAAGNQKLGCSLYELPPGCKAWPYHYHLANEEAIYILQGTGTLRLGGEEVAVTTGDYIAFPPSKATAHQLINRGNIALQYLCFSTMIEPDLVAYPDSGKVGVFAGAAPGGTKEKRTIHAYFYTDTQTDYWSGEE